MAKLPNANTIGTSMSSFFTIAQFTTFLEARFTACGFGTVFKKNPVNAGDPTILAYDLNIAPSFTYGRVAFIVWISAIETNGDFELFTGLCHHSNYDFVNFTYTTDFINAGGAVNTSHAEPSEYSRFQLNNSNGYTAYSFPTTLELIGVFLMETSGDNDMKACLGMAHLGNYNPIYDRNANSFIALLTDSFLTNFVSALPNNASSSTPMSLAAPFQGFTAFSNNRGGVIPNSHLRPDTGQASTFGRGGQFDTQNINPFIVFYDSGTYQQINFGNFSPDLQVGYGEFTAGEIIQVNAGVEEYFCIQRYGLNAFCNLLIQIDFS